MRNKNTIQTGSALTVRAFEMNMIMPVIPIRTGIIAERIACAPIVIKYLMNQTTFQKRFQRSVDSYSIVLPVHRKLNIPMRNSHISFEKNRNNIASALGKPKGMILQ